MKKGYFGQFGGRYVSETLMPLILEVEKEYEKIKMTKSFINEFNYYLKLMLEDLVLYFLQKEQVKI